MQYSIQDFLQAQIDGYRWARADPDLQTYFVAKAKAFRAAFGMPLDSHDIDGSRGHWHSLFSSALGSYFAIITPFSGYLEAPSAWDELAHQYGPKFGQQVEQMQELHRRFMLAILEKWYGPLTTTTVSSEDLLQHGFDDTATAPDPLDYIW